MPSSIGGVWLVLSTAVLVIACRSNPHDDVAPVGGSAGAASGGSGGLGGSGGSGAGGSGNCPLDATGKARLKTVLDAVLADAEFVASGSHGIAVGSMRAFGTEIPFTSLELRKSMTVTELCSAPKSFAPDCAAPEAGANSTFTRCFALSCETSGVLVAQSYIEPLPVELIASSPTETVLVDELESRVRYSDDSDGSLAIALDGLVRFKLSDGAVIRRTIGGNFLNGAPSGNAFDVLSSIEGIAKSIVALDATREGGTLVGDVIVNGVPIASIDENGVTYVGDCGGG